MGRRTRRNFLYQVFGISISIGSLPLFYGWKYQGFELPKVLIIGDSISIGYTPYVKRLLEGIAEVYHNDGNAQHTGTGIEKLNEWLNGEVWDLIQFNWGLWDLCYRHPDSKEYGNRDKELGVLPHTIVEYEQNLLKLVGILEKTRARLIWASTTPVPKGEAGRIAGDEVRYNEVARRIMEKHEIPINDLHSYMKEKAKKYQIRYGDVHFNEEGYKFLASEVAKCIKNTLFG